MIPTPYPSQEGNVSNPSQEGNSSLSKEFLIPLLGGIKNFLFPSWEG